MNITKCDICKKEIKKGMSSVRVGHSCSSHEFCEKCAVPVTDFLKKHSFYKDSDMDKLISRGEQRKK